MRLNARLVVAAALLLALTGAAVAFAAWQQPTAAPQGARHVTVVAPDGGTLFDGSAQAEATDALSLLQAAAAEAGLEVLVDEYPGLGAYVRAIGPYEAHGSSGWVFEISRDGAWVPGERSAAFVAVEEGESLRWRWSDEAR